MIRAIETHPFTIVSATAFSLELVVASYDGFTKALHKHATQHPGAALRASIDGAVDIASVHFIYERFVPRYVREI